MQRLPLVLRACPILALVLALASGCGGGDDTDDRPRVPVKVMTRNLFLGADLYDVITAKTVDEIPDRVTAFWQKVERSDVRGRCKRLAEEIAEAKPDLVGLQEVELFRTQSPSNFDPKTGTRDAETVVYDFLALLQTELEARGAAYEAVLVSVRSDAEMPGRDAAGALFDLRMTDRDAILVRKGIAVTNPRGGNFKAAIRDYKVGADAMGGGVPVEAYRGWGLVDVTIGGVRLTFGNSHLEVGGSGETKFLGLFQEAQAKELAELLATVPDPLIVVGDFNSAATGKSTASYATLTAKLQDAWPRARGAESGFTCCSDLLSSTFSADERIDLVLTRGDVRPEAMAVIGTDPAKRTEGGAWPSDHAGVTATLSLPAPR